MIFLLFTALSGTFAGYAISTRAVEGARAEIRRRIAQGRTQATAAGARATRQQVGRQMATALAGAGVTRARVDAAYRLAQRARLV